MLSEKPFRQLTDEQKGWLLLQHHKGHTIQVFTGAAWVDVRSPSWEKDTLYRVKPTFVTKTCVAQQGGRAFAISYESDGDPKNDRNFKITDVCGTP